VLGEPILFSMLQSAEEKSLLAKFQQELDGTQELLQRGEDKQAVKEFLQVNVGTDIFDSLPANVRSEIMDNARTLAPMLRTAFEPAPLDCDRARSLTVPTLLVRGEFSPEISRLIASRLESCLPHAELFVLPGASHGLQIEKPAEFNEAVQEFLAKQRKERRRKSAKR
jgi:pimeloyl-ACP methyl ester carboxylesterase